MTEPIYIHEKHEIKGICVDIKAYYWSHLFQSDNLCHIPFRVLNNLKSTVWGSLVQPCDVFLFCFVLFCFVLFFVRIIIALFSANKNVLLLFKNIQILNRNTYNLSSSSFSFTRMHSLSNVSSFCRHCHHLMKLIHYQRIS